MQGSGGAGCNPVRAVCPGCSICAAPEMARRLGVDELGGEATTRRRAGRERRERATRNNSAPRPGDEVQIKIANPS